MSAAVPFIPAIAAGVGTGYSIFSGERARKDAKKEASDMKREADARNAEFLQRQESDRRKKSVLSTNLRRSLLRSASQPGDRGGTILTSPLGLVDRGKRVLGS